MSNNRIIKLAEDIASNVAKINTYTTSKGLPSPSFDADSSPGLLIHPEISTLRQKTLDATDELHALMLGPVGILTPSVCKIQLGNSKETDLSPSGQAQLLSKHSGNLSLWIGNACST